jgi:hypothetical protein
MSQIRRAPHRQRGIYVPAQDAQSYLHAGWRILDECLGADEVLLAEPEIERNEAQGATS